MGQEEQLAKLLMLKLRKIQVEASEDGFVANRCKSKRKTHSVRPTRSVVNKNC
jgi:hypothetical protein